MRAGDVCAMPADIRHRGFAPKRAMPRSSVENSLSYTTAFRVCSAKGFDVRRSVSSQASSRRRVRRSSQEGLDGIFFL
jgi:hypothetical protein